MRFSSSFRQAVEGAQSEARRLGQPAVGTGHLFLALLQDEACTAAVLLRELGVDRSALSHSLESKLSEAATEAVDGPVRSHAGVTLDENRMEELVRAGKIFRLPHDPNRLPQTTPLKRSIERAIAESKNIGPSRELPCSGEAAPEIGTEHLLLGLLLHGDGVASSVLHSAGIDADLVRGKIARA